MFVSNPDLTESRSPLNILPALRVGVKVKVEFIGNACFHHVLFTLLRFFMATGAYSYSGKNTHRGYYHLIIHQGCSQVSSHVIQNLEKYLDMLLM